MDIYYKWDGTMQGVEGLELFLQKKVQFNPDLNVIHLAFEGREFDLAPQETVALLDDRKDILFIGKDVNVDAEIAHYKAVKNGTSQDEAYAKGSFEWALTQLAAGNAIRHKSWKPGRVIVKAEADSSEWELA